MSLSLPNTQLPATRLLPMRVVAAVMVMLIGVLLSVSMKPTKRLADIKAPINLEQQIPAAFGDWVIDSSIQPLVPDPTLQASIDALYSQTLTRTYVNSAGERVMLSIAYGSDQSSEATAVHRPEFCYSAQGFAVRDVGEALIPLQNSTILARHIVGSRGRHIEPITYWVTLDERTTLPGLKRRLEQIRFGLRGEIADGLLFRLSSWNPNLQESYDLHQRFVQAMESHVPAAIRARYFGS